MPTIKDVVDVLVAAVPIKDTWAHSIGETYGPYNIDSANENKEVNKVLYCVTPSQQIVDYAKANSYDLLVSHHPFVVGNDFPQVVLHTALDMCNGGLNDMWRKVMNIQNAVLYDKNLGWFGEIEPIKFSDLIIKVNNFTGGIIGQKKCKDEDRLIRSVCTCSGLGGFVQHIVEKVKPDVFITGQLLGGSYYEEEDADYKFSGSHRGLKLNAVIETGHTYSEWCGVYLFKKLLKPLNIQVDYVPMEIDSFGGEIG
jgi:putative NIF3 family GTP cyclohydrolase 1 type 2